MRRRLMALSVVGVLIGVASPAWAGTAAAGDDDYHVNLRPHCVLTAVEEDAELQPTSPPKCYPTFAQAFGSVTRDSSSVLLGIEYEDKSFEGWSYVIRAAGTVGCTKTTSFRVSTLPSTRNDEISSALAYSSCKSRHYSGANLTGSSHLCGCASMGSMNDQTSSIRFSLNGG